MAAWLSQEQLEKTGPDLFKEFLRYMPTVEYEDYFKNGVWKEDIMRLDLQMVVAHRLGAGAPEPLSLDEIPQVDLPLAAAKPVIQVPQQTGVLKAGAMGTSQAAVTGSSPVAPGVAELRLVALLVTKWKLDPTRTKTLLSQVSPAKRHYVIQNFKTEAGAGKDATDALEAYIKQQLSGEAGGAQPAEGSSKPAPKATITPQGTLKPAVPVGLAGLAGSAAPAKAAATRPALTIRTAPGALPVGAQQSQPAAQQGATQGIKRPLVPMGQAQPGPAPADWAAKRPRPMGMGGPSAWSSGMQQGAQGGMQQGMQRPMGMSSAGGFGCNSRPPMGGGFAQRPAMGARPQMGKGMGKGMAY
mmetsp:Transcript_17710/g.41064  ORF Transcript_17710/g.41064 Transcript_17710/m.41064 type:complete len:356 (-) Transcript_17710:90-1157(-)